MGRRILPHKAKESAKRSVGVLERQQFFVKAMTIDRETSTGTQRYIKGETTRETCGLFKAGKIRKDKEESWFHANPHKKAAGLFSG